MLGIDHNDGVFVYDSLWIITSFTCNPAGSRALSLPGRYMIPSLRASRTQRSSMPDITENKISLSYKYARSKVEQFCCFWYAFLVTALVLSRSLHIFTLKVMSSTLQSVLTGFQQHDYIFRMCILIHGHYL